MNRQIICDNGCKDRLTKLFGHDPETETTKFDGEYCKFVPGAARLDFICDQCGAPIKAGADCWAMSIWTDRTPYSNWEPGYIKARREEQGHVNRNHS